MEQDSPPGASFGAFLAIFGYVIGSLLVLMGAISFGFQLVLMPIGLALILAGAMRREPHVALTFFGGWIGVSLASWLSYSWGLAETIFQPHIVLLLVAVGVLAVLGYLVGRYVERVS
ncbi:MAG: hypothetical protein ACRDHM_02745 [Actinomycetota bacterium]